MVMAPVRRRMNASCAHSTSPASAPLYPYPRKTATTHFLHRHLIHEMWARTLSVISPRSNPRLKGPRMASACLQGWLQLLLALDLLSPLPPSLDDSRWFSPFSSPCILSGRVRGMYVNCRRLTRRNQDPAAALDPLPVTELLPRPVVLPICIHVVSCFSCLPKWYAPTSSAKE